MENLKSPHVDAIRDSEAHNETSIQDSQPQTVEQASQSSTSGNNPDMEQLIAEAEHRGYLRGRNEAVAIEMQRPAQWENETKLPAMPDSESLILNNMRRSVWDDA